MTPLERACRALWRLEGHPKIISSKGEAQWRGYIPQARAVVEALREPDEAMVRAATIKAERVGGADFIRLYKAMIDAVLAGERES